MFWSRLFGATPVPTASDAARVLAERAARVREAAAVPIAERRVRIIAELRRSGAVSPIRPREVIAAEARAERAARLSKQEKTR